MRKRVGRGGGVRKSDKVEEVRRTREEEEERKRKRGRGKNICAL